MAIGAVVDIEGDEIELDTQGASTAEKIRDKVKIMSTGYGASAISFKSLKIRVEKKKKKKTDWGPKQEKKNSGKSWGPLLQYNPFYKGKFQLFPWFSLFITFLFSCSKNYT